MAAFARSPAAPRNRRSASARASFKGWLTFPFFLRNGEVSADLELHFDRRGRYREDSFGLATRFPFAFLTKTRHVSLPPGSAGLSRASSRPTKPSKSCRWCAANGKVSSAAAAPISTRIREYMPEDSARHVDWKATAKSGSLKVREFAREDERRLCIAFDNPEPGAISERAYEKAVDLTASLAWHFSTQEREVSFAIPGRPRTRDLHEFLAWLAVIEPGMIAGDPSSHQAGNRPPPAILCVR